MKSTTPAPRSLGAWRGFRRYLKRSFVALVRSDKEKLREERRKLALHLLRGEAELVSFRRDGLLWTAFVWDTGVAKYLFSQGTYHGGEIAQLTAWLAANGLEIGPESVIVDVGGNIGTTSIPFARDTGARVLAIEPIPENARLFRQNVQQNGLDHLVTCVEAAISDVRGEVEMVLSLTNSGGAEIKCANDRQGFGAITQEHRVVRVPTIPLDELISEHGIAPLRVALVWTDTQGAETGVIRSGDKLWSAGVCLFTEVWPEGLETHGGVSKFLAAAQARFDRFVPSDALAGMGAPRPISELPAYVAAIRPGKFENALFLPPHFAPFTPAQSAADRGKK